jgi:hypothetical protein
MPQYRSGTLLLLSDPDCSFLQSVPLLLQQSFSGRIETSTRSTSYEGNMPDYKPQPIETSAIVLPLDLEVLTEKLAENVHDHWTLQRLSDGWCWGAKRDEDAKTHPSLVACTDLSESEKIYDRRIAIETLKAITALDCKIDRS